jgi:hypothetical protein
MPTLSNAAILVDGQGRPVTSQPATALASGNTSQSAVVMSGSDYATTPNAQIPRVDASGFQYAVALSATGVPMPVAVNAAGSATGSFGTISLGWDASTSSWRPYAIDATGAAITRNALAITSTFAPTAQVNTGSSSGKSMFSIYNGSTSMVLRLLSAYLMCPPQQAVSGGLLSTTTSYTTVGMSIQRFSGAHTGGTLVAGVSHDSRDTLDTGVTCRTGATISGLSAASLRVFDAAYSSIVGYGHREDVGVKVWTMQPGEGLSCQVLSAVGGSGINFYITAVVAQNVA